MGAYHAIPYMLKQFATTVITDEKGERTLLILREDFRIWALPGGGLESGETPEQAALRETHEESGYEVTIDKYIGKYHRPQFHGGRQPSSMLRLNCATCVTGW